jgi:hypothetical protein
MNISPACLGPKSKPSKKPAEAGDKPSRLSQLSRSASCISCFRLAYSSPLNMQVICSSQTWDLFWAGGRCSSEAHTVLILNTGFRIFSHSIQANNRTRSIYGSRALSLLGRVSSFLIWTGDQPITRPLPTRTTTQTQNKSKHGHPCLEQHSNPRSQCPSGRRRFVS